MATARLVKIGAAFALLCAIAAALAAESVVHTDDGCRVEIHCLACRLAVGTAVVVATALPPALALERDQPVRSSPARVAECSPAPVAPGRAPPRQ